MSEFSISHLLDIDILFINAYCKKLKYDLINSVTGPLTAHALPVILR